MNCKRCGQPLYEFLTPTLFLRAMCENRACADFNITVDTPAMAELRSLRVWHWRIAMNARRAAISYRDSGTVYSQRQAKTCDRRADFHIKAVQALNSIVNGTAEHDDALHIPSLGSKVK